MTVLIDANILKEIGGRRHSAMTLISEFPSKWTWPKQFEGVNWAGRQPPLLYEALKAAEDDIASLLGLVNEMVESSSRLQKATQALMGVGNPPTILPPGWDMDPTRREAVWALREIRAVIRRLGREP